MPLNDDQLRALLQATAATHDVELDCEQFLDAMAPLAELQAEGGPVPETLRLAAEHLALCANCREEYLALAEALRTP